MPGLVEVPAFSEASPEPPPEDGAEREPPDRPTRRQLLQVLLLSRGSTLRGSRPNFIDRELDVGALTLYTLLGELVGGLVGGTVGGLIGAATCENGEAQWLPGYHCGASVGFGIALGGLLGATLGGPIGVARADADWESHGSAWLALTGSLIGAAIGGAATALLLSDWDEPSWSVFVGGAVGLFASTVLELLFYEGSRLRGASRIAHIADHTTPRVHIEVSPNDIGLVVRGEI